jgi:hypothetical protein
MSAKPESRVVDEIIAWLEAHGGGGYKVYGNALQRGGEPDIDGQYLSQRLGRWIHLKLEVKYGEGETTARQDLRLEIYRRRGYCAAAVWGVAGMLTAITAYEDDHMTETLLQDRFRGALGHLLSIVRAWREPNELISRRATARAVEKAEAFILQEADK